MEGAQQRVVLRVLPIAVFGMPLHAHGKRLGPLHADRLDLPVLTHGLHLQALAEPVDALTVQRVHLHLAGADDALQQAALGQLHGMDRAVGHIVRHVLDLAVVQAAFDAVHFAVQGAAVQHVELLHTTADAEEGDAAVDTGAHQAQHGGVAGFVG